MGRQQQDDTLRARALRTRMTDAERQLWTRLRDRGVAGAKFRRQVPIGPFFADVACFERRLIVEVDGGHHAEAGAADQYRTRVLNDHGFVVLRFWNSKVLQNLDGVLAKIEAALREAE